MEEREYAIKECLRFLYGASECFPPGSEGNIALGNAAALMAREKLGWSFDQARDYKDSY
jgi:hypothetical protein